MPPIALHLLWSLMGVIVVVVMVHGQNMNACMRRQGARAQENCMMVQRWVQTRNRVVSAGLVNDQTPSVSQGTGLNTVFGQQSMQASVGQPPLSEVASMTGCLTIPCYCNAIGGRTNSDSTCTLVRNGASATMGRAVRQEYRTLTPEQRSRFHRALHALKFGTQRNNYNTMVFWHQAPQAPTAHGGPMFTIWHREFIKLLEFYLREVDPTIPGLPYWDSTLDNELEDARDSVLWSAELMGEASGGRIINGDFTNWTTVDGNPLRRTFPFPNGLITAAQANAIPFYDVLSLFAFTSIAPTCANPAAVQPRFDPFEYVHAGPHNFVNGDMLNVWTSPNDPMFFLHHSFVDKLYDDWRARQSNPETAYPQSQIVNDRCASQNHSWNSPMLPFTDIRNALGLSSSFANLYTYRPSPRCPGGQGCGSPYLFCGFQGRCAAKIRPGGNCQRFSGLAQNSEETNPCYRSRCVNGRCQGRGGGGQFRSYDIPSKPQYQKPQLPAADIKLPPYRDCYDNHECCPKWSKDGYCKNATLFMNVWCPGSCACEGCKPIPTPSVCTDLHHACQIWLKKKPTECQENERWMTANCAKSCGKCYNFDKFCSGGPAAKGFYVDPSQLEP